MASPIDRKSESRKNLTILLISAHPPIDYELTTNWVKDGHTVYLISHTVPWEDQFNPLDSSVNRRIPETPPNLIIVEHISDTLFAISLKIRKMWLRSKLVMIHWWFPDRNPVLYFFRNISVCQFESRYLRKILGIRSGVVYCPVDTKFFRKVGEPDDPPRILVIGNGFRNRKIMGFDHLLKILEKIHSLHPEFTLVITGTNRKEDFQDYVSVINSRKDELLREINRASVVFFTTTRNLIMNSMQIAMACERKVVAFDLEPFHEVIENGVSGFLIPGFDDDLFANTVIRAAMDKSGDMGKRARENIVQKCESEMVSKQIIEHSMKWTK